jgi:hypothetical protein
MVMVLVLLVVVRCPMVGEDDERQYVAFSFLPFSNLNDDTIPTCVSTYGASHMKFGWRGTHHFPPNRTRHTEYVVQCAVHPVCAWALHGTRACTRFLFHRENSVLCIRFPR